MVGRGAGIIAAVASSGELRASDDEREAAAARLREGAASGRLDPDEFERRLDLAYRARTHAELDRLTRDLPAPASARASPWRTEELRRRAAAFVTVNAICIAVWLATGAEGSFWPGWVLIGTGIGFFTLVVRALFGVSGDEEDEHGPPRPPAPPRLP
jgi:hypothetical protein